MRPSLSDFKFLAPPLYLVGVLMIVTPAVDFWANVWPPVPGDFTWRYGAVGLLSGFLLTPLLGAVMVFAAAATLGHRTVRRILGWVALVLTALFLVVLLMFALDVVQVRAGVPAEERGRFDFGSLRAALKLVTAAAALLWMGLRAVRLRGAEVFDRGAMAAPVVGQGGRASGAATDDA